VADYLHEVEETMSKPVSLLSALVVTCGLVSAAQALPANPVQPADSGAAILKIHGCHRSCEWGAVRGWHRHGLYCRPIACRPLAPRPNRCWVDWRGVRHCWW